MLKLLFSAALIVLVTACSPSEKNQKKIEIDKFTLIRQIEQTNNIRTSAHVIPRFIYNLPNEDFIYKLAQKHQVFKDSITYAERNKIYCTDWTAGAVFFAKTLDSAVLFGEFGYNKDTGEGHCVNFTYVLEKGELKLVFFEPQLSQVVKLTELEILSCRFWRF